MNLVRATPKQREGAQQQTPAFRAPILLRRFVETGQERCPLAGIWTQVVQSQPADDAETMRPLFRVLGRRAFMFA